MNAPTEQRAILATSHLQAGYRDGGSRAKIVIADADLQLEAGHVTCLLGANGAGKSTLLRTIAGQQPPLAGSVDIGGTPVGQLSLKQMARLISVVYTDRTNAGALTVSETVGLGRQPYTGFFGRLDDDDRRIVDDALADVGMLDMASRHLATLSDGERQKVMIARALAQQTPIVMLDEPTSFLDVASRLEVMALMDRLATDHGKAVLLSTHDIAAALGIASRLWLIVDCGKVVDTTPDRAVATGIMDRLFSGRDIVFDPALRDYRLAARGQ